MNNLEMIGILNIGVNRYEKENGGFDFERVAKTRKTRVQ